MKKLLNIQLEQLVLAQSIFLSLINSYIPLITALKRNLKIFIYRHGKNDLVICKGLNMIEYENQYEILLMS